MRTIHSLLLATASLAATACGDDLSDGTHVPGPPTTTATPLAGVYRAAPVVTLTANEEATIYYTVDGSAPTTASDSGASPVTIDDLEGGATVRFFAVDSEGETEEPAKEITYVVDRLGPAPVDDFVVAVDGRDASVTWNNPDADGFDSVVVARVTDSSATHPEDGETYEVGDDLPGEGQVVFVGTAEEAEEAGLAPGGVAYMAWARYDTGNYSEPRAHGTAVELPVQTGRLLVNYLDGTVTVSDDRQLGFFEVSGDNAMLDGGNAVFDLTIEPRNATLLYNVKFVVTGISTLVAPTMTNADGTIAGGGDNCAQSCDSLQYRYFGPEPMVEGTSVTRSISISNAAFGEFSVDFAIVRDRGVVVTSWWDDPDFGGSMYDFGSELSTRTLPLPVHYESNRLEPDLAHYRGAVMTWDGRFMIAGSRNMPRIDKIDLATMEVVGGLNVEIERDWGGVTDIVPNQARTRLYAIINDGMHTSGSQRSAEAYEDRLITRAMRDPSDVPDGNDVWVVEIDADTMEEVGRVHVGGGNILYRGRRGAIARDDRQLAVPTGEHWRELPDMELPDYTSFVQLVDLSEMELVDSDDEEDGVQPIDLTDVTCATAVTFTHDGARLVVNRNYDTDGTLDVLGAVIDLSDYSVETFDPPKANVEDGIKGYAALPDGHVVLGGDFPGLLLLDPVTGEYEPFGDYAGETYGMSLDPGGEIYIGDQSSFGIVDAESGDVVRMGTGISQYYGHSPSPTVY